MKTLMKSIALVIIAIAVVVGTEVRAQGLKGDKDKKEEKKKSEKSNFSSGEKCFDETTHIINLGVGFGGGNYYEKNSETRLNETIEELNNKWSIISEDQM
jgi:hypothetical protein